MVMSGHLQAPFEYEAEWTPEAVWTLWSRKQLPDLPGMEPRIVGRPARSSSLLAIRAPANAPEGIMMTDVSRRALNTTRPGPC